MHVIENTSTQNKHNLQMSTRPVHHLLAIKTDHTENPEMMNSWPTIEHKCNQYSNRYSYMHDDMRKMVGYNK